MPLDLFQRDRQEWESDIGNPSQPGLPATFGENFEDAVNLARLFSQSTAQINARQSVLEDWLGEIKAKTGVDMTGKALEGFIGDQPPEVHLQFDAVNAGVADLKRRFPELDLDPLDDAEIARRTVAKSRGALDASATMARREQTFGSRLGSLAGELYGGFTDPINLVAAPLAVPEGLGVLGTALMWGGIGGALQAANEALGGAYREQAQPGYLASGEPISNVLSAGAFGAVGGGAVKGLGAAWTRVKTGAWPRSVRDAGNLVESEADIAATNVLPGAGGEVAHRQALSDALDQIGRGEPVRVAIDPEILERSHAIMAQREGEAGISIPVDAERAIRLTSEEADLRIQAEQLAERRKLFDERAADVPSDAPERLARLEEVERQAGQAPTYEARQVLLRRRDELLTGTNPEALRAQAGAIEQQRTAAAAQESIAARLDAISQERAAMEAGRLGTQPTPLGQRQVVPWRDAEPIGAAEPRGMPEPTHATLETTTEARAATLDSPQHADALQASLEKAELGEKPTMVPDGVDEAGNPVMRPLDSMMDEVKSWQDAADQLEACALPAPAMEPA